MALSESSYREMRGQETLLKIFAFISASTTGEENCCFYYCKCCRRRPCKLQSAKAMQSYNKESGDRDTKHDCAYSASEFRRKYVCDNEL